MDVQKGTDIKDIEDIDMRQIWRNMPEIQTGRQNYTHIERGNKKQRGGIDRPK